MKSWFTPRGSVSGQSQLIILVGLIVVGIGGWSAIGSAIFPSPLEVLQALPNLWITEGFGGELLTSLSTNLQALAWSIAISLPIAYLSGVPVVNPITRGVAYLRFLTPTVFFAMLVFTLHDGHSVKIAMLTLGESFFLTRTALGVVQSIEEYRYDDATTLHMGPWQSLWYVTVRGTVPQIIDAIRDNAAMGWSMLMMVEGAVKLDGGVGVMLVNSERHIEFASIWAISIMLVVVGIGQDYLIGQIKKVMCPYDN